MKCLICERFSQNVICKICLDNIPFTPRDRILKDSIRAYSFYRYDDVALLMQSKYHLIGSRILRLLSLKAAKYFFSHIFRSIDDGAPQMMRQAFTQQIALVGLDDYPYGAYSHTGVIVRTFKKESKGLFEGYYGALKAQNHIKYAGQNLAFRESNPKGFMLRKSIQLPYIVLVDDIITTGTSLNEAISLFAQKERPKVIFCLTLCDARA